MMNTTKITDDCGHFGKYGIQLPGVYPSFNIGLDKPFALLIELCPKCAKKATKESILTNERWERMKKILTKHNIKIPPRKSVTMQLEKSIRPFEETYAYALAC